MSSGAARSNVKQGLAIVVPLFNEEPGLRDLHAGLVDVARRLRLERGLDVEVIYVDDGSRDATLAVAHTLPRRGLDMQVVSLSRNFGKEGALLAGLDHARHGAVLFMDGDGQHPPSLITTLVGHWLDDGYDVVYTSKALRAHESLVHRLGVKAFYRILNWGSRHKIPPDAGDFRLLSQRAAAALRRLPERGRFFKGLASWIGFRQLCIDYVPEQRVHGRSKWGLRALVGLSIDALTSFSVAPLRIASLLGFFLAVAAIVLGMHILVETWVFGKSVPGYPSLFVGMMFLGAVQLMMIGVLGEYIGKVLAEVKARPAYFVMDHSLRPREEEATADEATQAPAGVDTRDR
jgi:polyisoprenyl-phosphate glycosyltransferase